MNSTKRQPISIMPCVSSGIAMLREDGKTMDLVPFQVFQVESGATVIRIGNNTLWFDESGKFGGTECKPSGIGPQSPEADAIIQAIERSKENDGRAPDEAYFQPGSKGYRAEVAGWPKQACLSG